MVENYLPKQYENDAVLTVTHNYLQEQFSDYKTIFKKIENVVRKGDYTLGAAVDQLEHRFAQFVGGRFGVSVGSGTDALMLSLRAAGVSDGDKVITTPFTFYATIGAIVTSGAEPIFCDVGDDFNIDMSRCSNNDLSTASAVVPVHWAGYPIDMVKAKDIADNYNLRFVYDSCHAAGSKFNNMPIASFEGIHCFSFHPLKNLNVWGDGGIVVTADEDIVDRLKLLRNHGLSGRDQCEVFAYNSRLDTVQAVVADHMLDKLDAINAMRLQNAEYLNKHLNSIKGIKLPTYAKTNLSSYHLYSFLAEGRDELQQTLITNGIDAKVHYKVPMHLQPAARRWGLEKGAFPRSEKICESTLSLPIHEFVEEKQLDLMLDTIKRFYS